MQQFEKSRYSSSIKFQILLIIRMNDTSFNIKFTVKYIAIFTDGISSQSYNYVKFLDGRTYYE